MDFLLVVRLLVSHLEAVPQRVKLATPQLLIQGLEAAPTPDPALSAQVQDPAPPFTPTQSPVSAPTPSPFPPLSPPFQLSHSSPQPPHPHSTPQPEVATPPPPYSYLFGANRSASDTH